MSPDKLASRQPNVRHVRRLNRERHLTARRPPRAPAFGDNTGRARFTTVAAVERLNTEKSKILKNDLFGSQKVFSVQRSLALKLK